MSRYKLTAEARVDLLTIWDYVALDSVPAADRVIQRLEKTFALLARFPQIGHRHPGLRTTQPVLTFPVGSYVIVYRPKPKPVIVVRVLHGARDLDALL